MAIEDDIVVAALDLVAATDPLPGTDLPEEGPTVGATRSSNSSAWNSFCCRVEEGLVQPTCVIDFSFSDAGEGGKSWVLTGDDRYCTHNVSGCALPLFDLSISSSIADVCLLPNEQEAGAHVLLR